MQNVRFPSSSVGFERKRADWLWPFHEMRKFSRSSLGIQALAFLRIANIRISDADADLYFSYVISLNWGIPMNPRSRDRSRINDPRHE